MQVSQQSLNPAFAIHDRIIPKPQEHYHGELNFTQKDYSLDR